MPRIVVGGGLNENANPDPSECTEGQNFELYTQTTQFRPRAPQDLKGTATNSGSISGIMQLVKRDDTETTIVFEDDGATPTLYTWDGASTFTSKRTTNLAIGSKLRDTYWSLDDYLIITDLSRSTPIMQWNGTTAIRQKTGLTAGASQSVSSITRSGTTVTVTTSSAHGYAVGDLVTIASSAVAGYNAEWEIDTVPLSTTFTFEISTAEADDNPSSATVDYGEELFAKYGLVHQGRVWLFNIKTDDGTTESDNPHMCLASKFEDPVTYDTAQRAEAGATASDAFYILTPDLKPINAAFVFHNQLIISTTEGRLFKLTGSDATDYQFTDFYAGSAAIGNESFANIGNDAVYMRAGGNIESLSATEQFGDVRADDISRWIPDTVKDLTSSIVVYDQSNQKVFFFVSNKVLVFFKDFFYGGKGTSPWSVYKTSLANTFNAVSAKYMRRPGATTKSVYWGDSSGNIYDINGSGTSGDGGTETIVTQRKLSIQESPLGVMTGKVRYRRVGECQLTIYCDWSDEYNISDATITLAGPVSDTGAYYGGAVYYGGSYYYNQGFEFTNKVSTRSFSPSGMGESFIMELYLDTNVSFKIDHVEI